MTITMKFCAYLPLTVLLGVEVLSASGQAQCEVQKLTASDAGIYFRPAP